jgi:hypothetical protein
MLHRSLLRQMAFVRRNRCSALLAGLCLFIVIEPMVMDSPLGVMFLRLCMLGILFLAVWAQRSRRLMFWTVVALCLATAMALLSDRLADRHLLRLPAFVTMAALMAAVTISLLSYVLDRHVITTDKVFGAVSAYVLIAFSFASLFAVLQLVQPHAFHVAAVNEPDKHLEWSGLMYFSFTVLTSTGFGEITPASKMARALIVIEQVLGVMYVAFLVARLANMYGAARSRN